MPRMKFSSLLFVSGNAKKHAEYCELLGIADLKRSNLTFSESQDHNLETLVRQKIDSTQTKLPNNPFFVEHTALIIDSWKGLPGGLTQVFMDTVGNDGICKMLRAYKGDERKATAKIIIGYFDRENGYRSFEGSVLGHIVTTPRGTNNFGWDPIFTPHGYSLTYGEMSLEEKNKTSMRMQAVEKFLDFLTSKFEL